MTFQITSITHVLDDASKIVKLILNYNGVVNTVDIDHDSFATPESTKTTLIDVINLLVDAAAEASGNKTLKTVASISKVVTPILNTK